MFFIKTLYLCLVLRISTHIERLLSTNDCVIIPEFGGFVLHSSSAVYEPGDHRFCPPHKEIVFNPTLIHQDGLLPESYIQMYGMTFNQAQIALKYDVEALYNQIDQEREIHLEKIGVLKIDDDGKLFFEPDIHSSFLGLKPYGLYPFHLPPVTQYARKEKQKITVTQDKIKSPNVVYMPVNRALIRAIGVSVAAACLILFVSIPLKEVDPLSYSAGIIPCEITSNNLHIPDIQVDAENVLETEVEAMEEAVVANETTLPVVAETAQPTVKTEAPNQRIYYAIIGSFVTENQANRYMQEIKIPELTNMGIVSNDGRVRVYAGKFDNRKEAESYIYRLRANEKLKDTWLYIDNSQSH